MVGLREGVKRGSRENEPVSYNSGSVFGSEEWTRLKLQARRAGVFIAGEGDLLVSSQNTYFPLNPQSNKAKQINFHEINKAQP